MQQFTLRLNNRLVGIKETKVKPAGSAQFSHQQNQQANKRDKAKTAASADAHQIKLLNDRIKILELELQKAREHSFRAGYEEGRENALQEANRRIELARIEMNEMEIKYLEAIEQIEEPLLEMALRMAREVLARELKQIDDKDQLLKERLRPMLYKLVDQKKVQVAVHPEHLNALDSLDVKSEYKLPGKMELSFTGNPRLQQGEAFIQSEDFYVDGTFDNQLSELHEQLKNRE